MHWYICFAIASAVVLSAAVCLLLLPRLRRNRRWHLSAVQVLFAACFLCGYVLCLAPNYALHGNQIVGIGRTAVFSFQTTLRVFSGNSIYDAAVKAIDQAPEAIAAWYMILVLAVQVLAPVLALSVVLSFFRNVSAYSRYLCCYFRDVYVFSCVNPKSLALASDLRKNHPKACLVFASVGDDAQRHAVRGLDAICFKMDICSIRLGLHSKGKQISIFAIDERQSCNVDAALKLIDNYHARPHTRLDVFTTEIEGELVLAGADKGCMKVRRVNEVRSLVNRFLCEEGHLLFEKASPADAEGLRTITAVILGLGARGTEMLKALSWYCQMDGYRVRIHAFDADPMAVQRLEADCPELLSPEYNGVFVDGEAAYTICLHSGVDVTGKSFVEQIMELPDVTFAFISLGSDDLNLRIAVELRMLFERKQTDAMIHAVNVGGRERKRLSEAKNSSGQSYRINLIGDTESSFAESVILDSRIEADAFRRHQAYCYGDQEKIEDFWRHEYCYRSSMASAIHALARIRCGIPGAEKPEEQLTPEERDVIEKLEHRRWNSYMRSEGYIYSGSTDRSSRNNLAKMHNDLVCFSNLPESEKRKDSLVAAAGNAKPATEKRGNSDE